MLMLQTPWLLIHLFLHQNMNIKGNSGLSPWRRHQWGACILHRCWHRAYQSIWCKRASHPSSRTSSRAGCHGNSNSQSDQSWWRWRNSWDLRKNRERSFIFSAVPSRHQMRALLPFLTVLRGACRWLRLECQSLHLENWKQWKRMFYPNVIISAKVSKL